MPFLHMLPDVGMNYTFNRPLLDGTSAARLKELSAITPRIKDHDSWYRVWLEVAKKAEADKRWLDAACYYHGAEFVPSERLGMSRLYEKHGSFATSDLSMVVLAGSTLGGGTAVNWMGITTLSQ